MVVRSLQEWQDMVVVRDRSGTRSLTSYTIYIYIYVYGIQVNKF